MTSRERVLAALQGEETDHCPFWIGYPTEEVRRRLCAHFGLPDGAEEIVEATGSDFRGGGYASYQAPDGREPLNLGPSHPGACETVAEVEALPWPDPDYIKVDVAATREHCARVADYAIMGGSWACFFHELGWTMGQEEYLVKMHTHPAVVEAFTERIVDFHCAMNERIFSAAADLMDFFFFGNDFGTQRGLFISPELWRHFVLPGVRRLVDQARSFGLRSWLHSCGSIRAIIPDLIDIGIDAIHPVQVSAAGMSAEELGREFGGQIMFIGGIDVHQLLRRGTPEQVRAAVRHCRRHLGPSYAVSPSHESILPDVPTENLVAMIEEAAKNGDR